MKKQNNEKANSHLNEMNLRISRGQGFKWMTLQAPNSNDFEQQPWCMNEDYFKVEGVP